MTKFEDKLMLVLVLVVVVVVVVVVLMLVIDETNHLQIDIS